MVFEESITPFETVGGASMVGKQERAVDPLNVREEAAMDTT